MQNIKSIIEEFVLENFDQSELENPSWDITLLAEHISKRLNEATEKPILQFEKPTIEQLVTFAMAQYASDCDKHPVNAYLELFHYDANDENDNMGWEYHTGITPWCYFENVRAVEFLGFVDDMVTDLMRFLSMDTQEFYQWQIANTR